MPALQNRENLSGPDIQAPLASLYRQSNESGTFIDFLAKFNYIDENTDFSEANESQIREHFEIFQIMPAAIEGIKSAMRDPVVGEKMSIDLGYKPTEQDLKAVEEEISKKVFGGDLQFLRNLNEQVKSYRELPQKVAGLEAKLSFIPGREQMVEEAVGLGQSIGIEEQKFKDTKEVAKGAEKAGETALAAKGAEKVLGVAIDGYFGDAEKIYNRWEATLKPLEARQKRLVETFKKVPELSTIALPNFPSLAGKFKSMEKDKKIPWKFVREINASGFVDTMEEFKKDQARACQEVLDKLTEISQDPEAAAKYPDLASTSAEVSALITEVGQAPTASQSGERLKIIASNLELLYKSRKFLRTLREDPGNASASAGISQELNSWEGGFPRSLNTALGDLFKKQNELTGLNISPEQAKQAAEYSTAGIFKRVVLRPLRGLGLSPRDVAREAAGQARQHEAMAAGLKARRDDTMYRIGQRDQTEQELEATRGGLKQAKEGIFLVLDSTKSILAKQRDFAEKAINKLVESEDLESVFRGFDSAQNLAMAKQSDYELYGDYDDDADDEKTLTGGRSLKQLQEHMTDIITEKVNRALMKALEKMKPKEYNPDAMGVNLKAFENSLGPLAKDSRYLAVKEAAVLSLLRNGSFPKQKKIALKILLAELEAGGSFGMAFAT